MEEKIEQTTRVLVLIPARFASTRFPGKPLVEIAGKSMIRWVFDHCLETQKVQGQSSLQFESCVVTDNTEIENHINNFGGKVVRVDDDVPSGTERIFLAYQRYFQNQNFDLIINLQGDEPLIKAEDLIELAQFHLKSTFDICTLVKKQNNANDFSDPNRVKVAWSQESGHCFYFSRAPIPYDRDKVGESSDWWQHVGLYSYLPKALKVFCEQPISSLENLEKLEQLRALEVGLIIGATETQKNLIGVDVPEDIQKLEGVLK